VTPPSYEEFSARRAFGSLDGIRCFSILAVVWHHTVSGAAWLPATQRGFLGVDMFFVLSGFLITTLLLRERDRSQTISLRRFYARRALRIFPVYYALLALTTAVLVVVTPTAPMRAPFMTELPYYLTYTANWVELHTLLAIAWSLAAEEQFYLVWPPIEKLVPRAAVALLLLVIGINELVNFRVVNAAMLSPLRLEPDKLPMLQATFTPICLGVLLAHVLRSRGGYAHASRLLSSRCASLVALAAIVALASVPSGDIAGWQRLSIQLSMAALLCACVLREQHALAGVLRSRWISRIGVVSYGMYLFHPFARHAAEALLRKAAIDFPLALFGTCLCLTVAIAELSYRFFEGPFLRFKERLRAVPDKAQTLAARTALPPRASNR
jgi:peptidoglycan/LPS O-acetylase OafA/YrhL